MTKLPKWLPYLILLFVILWAVQLGQQPSRITTDIPYTTFKAFVVQGKVASVTIEADAIEGSFIDPQTLRDGQAPSEFFRSRMPAFGDPELLSLLEKTGVEINVREEATGGASALLLGMLPWLLLFGFYFWFLRRNYGSNLPGGMGRGGNIDKFLRPGGGRQLKEMPDVDFSDVAGQENAKREVAELITYLRSPETYRALGAEVPHGILLMGPPGTGKTLLARALAGEAGVPFFSISASEFIEMFVGVGAARVRNLFEEAKANAPSIVFIDELDSVGRVRGAGFGGGHDEREQTLNQILAELDGFMGHQAAVVVLAATNRPDVLDPALLRPGRFDRHVTLDMPDRKARREILQVHARRVPLAPDVDLDAVAGGTPGFSGADLKNLVNEAAMMAAREGAKQVTARHFDDMRDRVLMGSVRVLAIEPEERHRLAVHEAGHTTAAYFLEHVDPLFKVSIIPRGRSLGGTQLLPERERYTQAEDFLKDQLAMILGGRAAEKIVLDTVSSGADDDIRRATQVARAMVSRWGMSDEVGPMDVRDSEEHPFLGREIAQPRRTSETTAHAVDEAVRRILTEAEARATEVITSHRGAFDDLVAQLEAEESLDRPAIEACLGTNKQGRVSALRPR